VRAEQPVGREEEFDAALWRSDPGRARAVILAVMANQSSLGSSAISRRRFYRRRSRSSWLPGKPERARGGRRIDTLNSDRDSYIPRHRPGTGLDSVTEPPRQGSAAIAADAEPQPPKIPTLRPSARWRPRNHAPCGQIHCRHAEPPPSAVYSAAKDAAKTTRKARAPGWKRQSRDAKRHAKGRGTIETAKARPQKPHRQAGYPQASPAQP